MSDGVIRLLPEGALAASSAFKPVSWFPKIEFIQRLILNNSVLIALLGEQGSGKTTFVNLLQAELAPEIKSFVVEATPSFDSITFLQQLKKSLTFSDEPSISNFISQSKEQGSHVLLIIDNAHYLSAIFIEEGSGCYFHVLLASDFSLVATLNTLAHDAYEDMIHSIEIGALSESETKAYVVRSLFPGLGGEKIVTDKRMAQFYQLTEGNRVQIDRHMTTFFSNETKKLVRNDYLSRYVNLAAAVLLAVTVITYIWHSNYIQAVPPQVITQTPLPIPVVELALSSDIPAYYVSAVRQALIATPLHLTELVAIDEQEGSIDESMVVLDKVIVAPKVLPQQAPKISAVIEKPTKIQVTATAKLSKRAALLKPIIEQSKYTIQLLASHNKLKLQRFAQVHHLKNKTQLRQTQRLGKVWYVLTLGEYEQPQQAKKVVNKLPKNIAQFKPWVRPMSDLKVRG